MNRMTQELELDCLDQLEATPAILRGLMCDLSAEDTEWKPAPDRFSVAEVLAHLSHSEGHCYRTRVDLGSECRDFRVEPWPWMGVVGGAGTNQEQKTPASQLRKMIELMFGFQRAAHPVVTRATENETQTGSLALSAPFCPRAFLLSVHPSGRWMVGAVGIEPTTFGLKGRCSTTELRP
jgi:DinB superfamily